MNKLSASNGKIAEMEIKKRLDIWSALRDKAVADAEREKA